MSLAGLIQAGKAENGNMTPNCLLLDNQSETIFSPNIDL